MPRGRWLFFGAQVGVNITQNFRRLLATDATPAMTEQITTAAFSTGPQVGALFFVSAKTAAQLQYDLIDSQTAAPAGGDRLITLRNAISLGHSFDPSRRWWRGS